MGDVAANRPAQINAIGMAIDLHSPRQPPAHLPEEAKRDLLQCCHVGVRRLRRIHLLQALL